MTVLILWYTYGNNLGDRLLYEVVNEKLISHGFATKYCEIGVSYRELESKLEDIDFIWFAGGGIIERGIPNIVLNMERIHSNFSDVPYGVTGLSIGGFDYSQSAEQLSYWVRNSSFFFTRDKYSAEVLNKLSCSDIAKFSADVVFSHKLKDKFTRTNNSDILGLNFRDVPYTDLTGDLEWNEWSEKIRNISNRHQLKCNFIADESDEQNRLTISNCFAPKYTVNEALSSIINSKIIIAMRFHVVLLASIFGIPVIPINYCPKVGRLAEQLEISELILGIHDFDKLEQKFDIIIKNYDDISSKLKFNSSVYSKRSEDMFNSIFSSFFN